MSETLPDRECGSCHACCKYPSIVDQEFKKPNGALCTHWAWGKGCKIYETRPGTCRSHYCGWRIMPQLDESWRPDRSNIYLNIMPWVPTDQRDQLPAGPQCMIITIFGVLSVEHLAGLTLLIQAMVQCEYPAVLMGAAPAGYMRKGLPLNYLLQPYLAKGNAAFADASTQILCACVDMPMVEAKLA